ncbi:hypothetical protein FMEAI12_4660034 [Parafrankia sp. Ea1.12]|nr:hypothetical protein FMEAI12_4660034 [Parafrankia sp. Ea1.12]
MPTSVVDRLSTTHEVIYLLTRSRRYFFDLDTIRTPHASSQAAAQARAAGRVYPPESAVATIRHVQRTQRNTGLSALKANGIAGHPLGKNPGDVWRLATADYRGSHFASFPVSLIERPLLASAPERVCTACSAPWRRKSAPRRGWSTGTSTSRTRACRGSTTRASRNRGRRRTTTWCAPRWTGSASSARRAIMWPARSWRRGTGSLSVRTTGRCRPTSSSPAPRGTWRWWRS